MLPRPHFQNMSAGGLLVQGSAGTPQDSLKHAQYVHIQTKGVWDMAKDKRDSVCSTVSQAPEGVGMVGHLPPHPK